MFRKPTTILAGLLAAAIPAASQAKAPTGNPAAGKIVFLRCAACHAIQKGAPDKVGPNLNGVSGRKAGALSGFKYSPALANSRLVWDDTTLDKWLTRPSSLVPGTLMVFAGLPKPEDRANVIAYLRKPTP